MKFRFKFFSFVLLKCLHASSSNKLPRSEWCWNAYLFSFVFSDWNWTIQALKFLKLISARAYCSFAKNIQNHFFTWQKRQKERKNFNLTSLFGCCHHHHCCCCCCWWCFIPNSIIIFEIFPFIIYLCYTNLTIVCTEDMSWHGNEKWTYRLRIIKFFQQKQREKRKFPFSFFSFSLTAISMRTKTLHEPDVAGGCSPLLQLSMIKIEKQSWKWCVQWQ